MSISAVSTEGSFSGSPTAGAVGACGEALVSFESVRGLLQGAVGGAFFGPLRKRAWECAKSDLLPLPSEELWRQTPSDLFEFGSLGEPCQTTLSLCQFEGGASKPGSASTELPKGVTFYSDENAASFAQMLEESLWKQSAPYRDHVRDDGFSDVFAWLQIATSTTVSVIHVARGANASKPVLLSTLVSGVGNCASTILLVILEEGSSISVVEDLDDESARLFMPRFEFIVGRNASLNFISLQRLGNKARYCARHRVHQYKDSRSYFLHVALGAGVSRLDFDCRMLEAGGSAVLHSAYLADGTRHIDLHPNQIHLAPHCTSNLYSKGVIKDKARTVYYGYIRVAEGAQKTDAYQTNRNLLLSSDARADSVPNLEIKANDVKCSHGSTIGQISADELFYLMSRGLPRADAEQLLVEAFFEDLLAKLKQPELHDYIGAAILKRLHKASSATRIKSLVIKPGLELNTEGSLHG